MPPSMLEETQYLVLLETVHVDSVVPSSDSLELEVHEDALSVEVLQFSYSFLLRNQFFLHRLGFGLLEIHIVENHLDQLQFVLVVQEGAF